MGVIVCACLYIYIYIYIHIVCVMCVCVCVCVCLGGTGGAWGYNETSSTVNLFNLLMLCMDMCDVSLLLLGLGGFIYMAQ